MGGEAVNFGAVYSRSVISWKLAFVYAGKMLHHLTSAILMTLASAGLGFAWLCCWLDRFRSGKQATSWILSARPAARPAAELRSPDATAERMQPITLGRTQPRTIDSLIRNKGAGMTSRFS